MSEEKPKNNEDKKASNCANEDEHGTMSKMMARMRKKMDDCGCSCGLDTEKTT